MFSGVTKQEGANRHRLGFQPLQDDGNSEPTEAIQKIMSAPLVVDRRVVGVIQISRKANSAPDAGPDFTHQQLRELKIIAEALAPCISLGVKAHV